MSGRNRALPSLVRHAYTRYTNAMHRYSVNRPRYPQKRRTPRVVLLAALPALLILLLIGSALILGDETAQDGAMRGQQDRGINELTPEQAYPQGPLFADTVFDKLLLEKSEHRLTAYAKGRAVRVYLVALGENPIGPKEFQGDRRTPEGAYVIDGKNPNSAYYKNLGISYPDAEDRKRAARQGKNPGGDIKIHGLAPDFAHLEQAHRITDWTHGCAALTNDEIDELYSRTPVGTPIEIVP